MMLLRTAKVFLFSQIACNVALLKDGHLYDMSTYNLDYINSGKVLFDLYKETGKEKYKAAMDLLVCLLYTSAKREKKRPLHIS